MSRYLIGIDIGTSACKVAIFNKLGEVIASSSHSYKIYYPQEGYVEQDPEEWWKAICIATKEVVEKAKIDIKDIVGVGIDGQSWSAIPIDKEGNVLAKTPIWMDIRSQDICERINETIGTEEIFNLAGNSLQPSYTTAKIIWFKENMPEVFLKTDKFLQSNSFVVFKLTNKISQDKSQGYGLHCFDMRKGKWDYDMCDKMGIPRHVLPEIFECSSVVGSITKEASLEIGLVAGTPVVAGGLDAACGALGAGVINPQETQEQGGQAGGMSICMEEYSADPRLILGFHVIPNLWLLQGGTTGGGGAMRWFEQEFADFERELSKTTMISSLVQLNEKAKVVPAGSDGLVFLPYMAGERSPIWNPYAKGVYYGLDFSKSKGHMVRALMEGVAFSLKHNLDIACESGAEVKTLLAMGGSANSLLWTQIKADVTGIEIKVPSSDTATTLGAAILAGVGVGLYKDFQEAIDLTVKVTREHKPNAKNHEIYKKNYKVYKKLYENLKDMMKKEV